MTNTRFVAQVAAHCFLVSASLGVTGCWGYNNEGELDPNAGRTISTGGGGQPGVEPVDASVGGSVVEPPPGSTGGETEGDASVEPPEAPQFLCKAAITSEPLPARAAAISGDAQSGPRAVFTSELFSTFRSHCGGCHVETFLGDYQVSLSTFPAQVTLDAVVLIESNDLATVMPPPAAGGAEWDQRAPDDPIRVFAKQLRAWIDQGSPSDVFYLEPEGEQAEGVSPYLLTEEIGTGLTNLGNCVPHRTIMQSPGSRAAEMDAFFDEATTLPRRLEETDLHTLDGETLARERLVAFAPAYPLFSDNAKKIRHVRVPLGKSVHFDKAKQEFTIPPNTRFYKTFLREVVDADGNKSFRKMETRLIVSRPNRLLPDGSYESTALFGTYAWNEEETEAVLVEDPLRDGAPFADRLVNLITDEQHAEEVMATEPENLEAALQEEGVLRRYAIPGSPRCIQCHMGSNSESFILGFSPLQLHRRPHGEGGVFEDAGEDELTQLQRLIDYGLITGMTSVEDMNLLEDSQGDREPRSEEELTAQGYMVGNCAFCHNPRGFATVSNPVLGEVLNFFPNENGGGVFQFPLERYSPRIKRGANLDRRIPYITPSIYDALPISAANLEVLAKTSGGSTAEVITVSSAHANQAYTVKRREFPNRRDTSFTDYDLIRAPWRSLIYRNVQSPFTYADNFAFFPHMPLHVPGYDCRVKNIMADWMVSIPARRKVEPDPTTGDEDIIAATGRVVLEEFSAYEQPYEEVLPDDPDYERMARMGRTRLNQMRSDPYYDYCHEFSDILDQDVVQGKAVVPQDTPLETPSEILGVSPLRVYDGVPNRPHWVGADLTNPAGDWAPRRLDWELAWERLLSEDLDTLVARELPVNASPNDIEVARARILQEKTVLELLQDVTITPELLQLALEAVPYGEWKAKEGCDFSSIPTFGSVPEAERPLWLTKELQNPNADRQRPLYSQSAGAATFNQICANCHGIQADSTSNLANTILQVTGGDTRVANLRDGLLGELGLNREREFGAYAQAHGLHVDDVAARYVVWMGLGGTRRVLPQAALLSVANSPVLGFQRSGIGDATEGSANMLIAAVNLCRVVLPTYPIELDPYIGQLDHSTSRLIEKTGDAEVWTRICSANNPQPVRVLRDSSTWTSTVGFEFLAHQGLLYWSRDPNTGDELYPPDAPVGTSHGFIENGVQPDNLLPWCIERPVAAEPRAIAEAYVQAQALNGQPLPFCPDSLFTQFSPQTSQLNKLTSVSSADQLSDVDKWALRGAINAGIVVFLYLDALSKGEIQPVLAYNECEKLGQQSSQ